MGISIPIAELDGFYKAGRFAFFMVDVDSAKATVVKVAAPINGWKPSRFWDGLFLRLKRLWDEKMEAIKIGRTEFGLELTMLEANAPDLLERVLETSVGYLG